LKPILFILCFFFNLCFPLQAQYANISFDHYSTSDGLSNKEVSDITQDKEGFIWIATRGGLNRFDGKDFVKYYSTGSQNQLPSNDISHIELLPHHRLAIGTAEGIGILNTHTGLTRQLIIPSVEKLKIYTNRVTDLVVDTDNNIIAVSYNGVYIFDSLLRLIYRYDRYSKNDISRKRIAFAFSIHLLSDGTILIPTSKNFLLLDIRKRKIQSVDKLTGIEWDMLKQLNKNIILLLKSNTYGQGFWIANDSTMGSLRLGIMDILKQKTTVVSLPFPLAFKKEISWKSRMYFLNDSVFAINSSHQNGFYLFKINAEKTSIRYEGKLLPNIQCNASFVDINGRLWMGTDDGIFKQSFSKTAFHNFYTPAIGKVKDIDNCVNGFIRVRNTLFVSANAQGVLLYNEKGSFLQRINFKKLNKYNLPWNINLYTKDTLLIPTQMGPLLLSTKNDFLRNFWHPGIPAVVDRVAVTANFIDSHHQLWLGMGSGFGVFMMNMDTRKWKFFSPAGEQNVFPLRYPRSITEDYQGNIWMSGTEGVTRWNQQKQIFDTLIEKIPGLPNEIIGQWTYTTTDKEGNLWICPEEFVLVKYNLQTNQISIFHKPNNLSPLRTYQINGPWHNCLWIQTDVGLLSFNVLSKKFVLLKKDDGLPEENMSSGGLYYDSVSGRLYAGFNNAFSWFYPDKVLQRKLRVTTYITDIRKNGDTVSYAGNSKLTFNHSNSVTISYTGINFDDGQLNTYAYCLFEKQPSAWIKVGNQKTLNFANLKPGSYTFQVKTILSDGTESTQPAAVNITIVPAYYQTWWFYILCTIAIFAVIYLLYRYRINLLLRVQNVRNNISSDLHDDIGAKLTNINILTMLSAQNLQQPEISSSYLNRITNEIQSSGEALDDIVWSINSRNDLFPEIVARMRRYAAEAFDAVNISFQFSSDKQLTKKTMSMEQRRDLFLVYKEAINNIQKHAQATMVQIYLTPEKKFLHITITDNGKGFDTLQATNRNGLKNMRNRIEKWKGSFVISSSASAGTTLSIRLPQKRTNR
jgi:ligand-binding sensor domain-containing protein/two-component sensor histidine kinase